MTDYEKLRAPFEAKDIEWRVQQSGVKNGKPWAQVLAYVTNRAIQNRLDDVFTPMNWRNEYQPAPDGGILCGISIWSADRKEWVTKWDGAEKTDIEAVKGGLSNAMKRAAVQWGIGRYLYDLDATFVQISTDRGEHFIRVKDKASGKDTAGYWNTPKLPDWALPTVEVAPNEPTKLEDITVEFTSGNGATEKQVLAIQKLQRAAGQPVADLAELRQLSKSAASDLITELKSALTGGAETPPPPSVPDEIDLSEISFA